MLITINGTALAPQALEPIVEPAQEVSVSAMSYLANDLDVNGIEQMLVDMGQDVLIATGTVFAVICGILLAIGLRQEAWKRFSDIFQGLGVGLIGPTAVGLTAAIFIGIAKTLGV